MPVAALLLAAGAGRRMGTPKALLGDPGGSWLQRGVDALRTGGCDPVLVVLGAAADQARGLVSGARTVVAPDWADGMGASLRAGLAACADLDADAAVISLVDLPDVDERVVARVLGAVHEPRTALVRAVYQGVPGHPVVIGRDHWDDAADVARGDQGARALFAVHDHTLVECADLATGRDVDTPQEPARA